MSQRSPEEILKALDEKGISREDLLRAFEKDDPVVAVVRVVIPRQVDIGCPVHKVKLRRRDVEKMPRSSQEKMQAYLATNEGVTDDKREDGHYVHAPLDCAGLHPEDIARALIAL